MKMVSLSADGRDAQGSGAERMSIISSKEEKGGRYNGPDRAISRPIIRLWIRR